MSAPPNLEKPLRLPLSKDELDAMNAYLFPLIPEEILGWGLEYLPGLYQTTAFGLTGLVTIDMLSKLTPTPPPLIFIDTLYHFPETYELVENVKERYNVPVHIYKPKDCDTVDEFAAKYGEKLWETDEDAYDYVVKVEPGRRAYDGLHVQSVITGRRASQGGDRANLQPLEVDSTGLLKLNPLFAWNFHLVEWYIKENKVPRNKLLDQGYKSVGDWHSTVKVGEGEDERAGRWAGKEKTECGLHKDYFVMKANAQATNLNNFLMGIDEYTAQTSDALPAYCYHVTVLGPCKYPPGMQRLRNRPRDATVTSRTLLYYPQRYHTSPPLSYPRTIPSRRNLDKMASRRGPTTLPSLPNILSSNINQQVFTHRSFHNRPVHVFEDHPGDLSPDNERLEHLGDTVLNLIVTTLIMEMYPGLHVGPLTKIRSMIVGNTTLAEISRKYKLPQRLVLHPAQAVTLRASFNIQADVFEAFVGGLYQDQGENAVRSWLIQLLRPYISEAYRMVRRQHCLPSADSLLPTPISSPPSSPSTTRSENLLILSGNTLTTPPAPATPSLSPLALFNQHISKINRHVEWTYSDGTANRLEDALAAMKSENRGTRGRNKRSALEDVMVRGSKSTPVWLAKVFVDGECFGTGCGTTKRIARSDAAKQGLQKLDVSLDH